MTTSTAVSAAIPAYNSGRFLAEAIKSALAQTRPCSEILVIDDGSTDDTPDVARSFGEVRYVRQENRGDAGARNRAIAEARGDLIAFLDSDDLWEPEKIERQMELFGRDPDLGLAYTGVLEVSTGLRPLRVLRAAPGEVALRNTLLVEKPYMTGIGSSGVARIDVARKVGFDERLRASADWAFACRVAMSFKVDGIPDPLVLYRQHSGTQVHLNLSAVEADMCLTMDELFSDARLDPELARLKRRAIANLNLSLSASYHKQGDRRGFIRHLARALVRRPDRVAGAFWRRYLGPSDVIARSN